MSAACAVVCYGRGGDIIMAVPTVMLAAARHAEVILVVGTRFAPVGRLLQKLGLPVCKIVEEPSWCPARDQAVSGSWVGGWGQRMMRERLGFSGEVYNACVRGVPPGVHMTGYLAYLAGLWPSVSVRPPMPVLGEMEAKNHFAVHFGSSDKRRVLRLFGRPKWMDGEAVCVGGEADHIESWVDRDWRGKNIEETAEVVGTAKLVFGSDSLVTHLGGVMGRPTICVHSSQIDMLNTDRSVYRRGRSVLGGDRGHSVAEVVRELLA